MKERKKVKSSDIVAGSGPRRRFPIYMYPARNRIYKEFVETWPAKGNAPLLRKLATEGFLSARQEIDDWVARVKAASTEEETYPPIPDYNASTTREADRFDLHLKESDPIHRQIIEFSDGLVDLENELNERFYQGTGRRVNRWRGKLRQRFFALILIRGSQIPDINEKVRGL